MDDIENEVKSVRSDIDVDTPASSPEQINNNNNNEGKQTETESQISKETNIEDRQEYKNNDVESNAIDKAKPESNSDTNKTDGELTPKSVTDVKKIVSKKRKSATTSITRPFERLLDICDPMRYWYGQIFMAFGAVLTVFLVLIMLWLAGYFNN